MQPRQTAAAALDAGVDSTAAASRTGDGHKGGYASAHREGPHTSRTRGGVLALGLLRCTGMGGPGLGDPYRGVGGKDEGGVI